MKRDLGPRKVCKCGCGGLTRINSSAKYNNWLHGHNPKYPSQRLSVALKALAILRNHNPLRNDIDAYLFAVTGWGLGTEEKPDINDYMDQSGGGER